MKELTKLEQAAETLEFQITSKVPATSPVIGGRTYQVCALDDPFDKKLFLNKPSSLQCQAMRAILYFWKVLRLREAVVYENDEGNPAVKLDFGENRVEVELPSELGMGPVSPVRMIANLVFGKLHDEAIATRGVMASEELDDVNVGDLVPGSGEREAEEDDAEIEGDVTGVRRMQEAAQPQAPGPQEAPTPPRARPAPAAPPRPSTVIGGGAPASAPRPAGRSSVIIGASSSPTPVQDDDVVEEIEDISDSMEIIED